jgi:predicted ABC-type ATPase
VPTLVLIAGPNGSGKSTLAAHPVIASLARTPEDAAPPLHINADQIRQTLRDGEAGDELDLRAARLADEHFAQAIKSGRSVIRETVLSTTRLLPMIEDAKARGFRIVLLFVFLRDPALNVARVAQRAQLGGHDVPEDKVRSRWIGAMQKLEAFAPLADVLMVFDNSARASRQAPRSGPLLLIERTPLSLYIAPQARILAANARTPAPLRRMLDGLISA